MCQTGEKVCKNCGWFVQHYRRSSSQAGVYEEVAWGHCCTPRLKARQTSAPACDHFILRKD